MRARKLVVAALIEEGGQVLLSRRRADQALPLCWEFPGGKVEPGESPEAALVREIREELGCGILVGPINEVIFHAYDDFDLVMLVYACTVIEGRPQAVQVADVAWFAPAQIPALPLPPADVPFAQRLARRERLPVDAGR